jgi:peptidoglycan/LPS O-acetylase OafA/YrhL
MPITDGNKSAIENQYSVILDLVRFGAAVTVFLSHVSSPQISHGLLPDLTQYGVDAVTLFFVLSGFVISHTAQAKDASFADYLTARVARLWSVAVPALLLSIVLSYYGFRADPSLYERVARDSFGTHQYWAAAVENHPALRLVAGVLFLNEAFSVSIVEFYNAPYWSLSYEFCYYLIFGIFFYVDSWRKYPAILIVCAIFGPKILLLFPIWLAGVALHRWHFRVPSRFAWPCILGAAAIYAVASAWRLYRYAWWPDQFVPFPLHWSYHFAYQYFLCLLIGMALIGFRSLDNYRLMKRMERPIRILASKTLSIYLFHFPIVYFLGAVMPADWPPIYRTIFIVALAAMIIDVLSRLTEAQKGKWRRGLAALVAMPGAVRAGYRRGGIR